MTDAAFIQALEACSIPNHQFGHRDHIRAAWVYLQRYPLPAATRMMDQAIRRFARYHGHAEKYHNTLTVLWTRLVAVHAAAHPETVFERFIARNQELLDKWLVLRFYTRERLFSPRAREAWLDPDVRALPELP
jgi:hypothetical protein